MSLFTRFKNLVSRPQRNLQMRPAERLYQSILVASRQAEIYTEFKISDSLDGRFDVLCLYVSLIMRRLRQMPVDVYKALNQELFDRFFEDMDLTLREMGVGDLGVARRIRQMSEAFMGRLLAYNEALAAEDKQALAKALARNIRRTNDLQEIDKRLAAYVVEKNALLTGLHDHALAQGEIDFVSLFALQGSGNG